MNNQTAGESRVQTPPSAGGADAAEPAATDASSSDLESGGGEDAVGLIGARTEARLIRLPFTRYHLRLAIVLALTAICCTYELNSTNAVKPALRATLHLSAAQAGWVGAIMLVTTVVGGRLSVVFEKRLAPRRTLGLSLLTYGVLAVASGLAWDFLSLLVFRALLGICLGVQLTKIVATVRESNASPRRIPLAALAVISPGFGLVGSLALGSALQSALSDGAAWRLMLAIGGLASLLGLYVVTRLPESPRWLASRGRHAEADRIVGTIEDSVLRRGGRLKEPQVLDSADAAPRVPAVLAKPYVRRTVSGVALAVTVLFTYNVFFN